MSTELHAPARGKLAAICIACLLASAALRAQPVASTEAASAPRRPVIALLAAVGDQLSVVRQREGIASHVEPFSRRVLPIKGQTLNMAVLRGLDQALAETEPQSQRVLLRWSPPPDTEAAMAKASGPEREELLLQALIRHLGSLPQRSQWDRIEAVLPKYFRHEIQGMGSKLSGVGIFVQPLARGKQIDLGEDGMSEVELDDRGSHRTIDPRTGRHGHASTYLAPYVYFERITIDAASLQVLARQRQFDNVKYHDPQSTAIDVAEQLPVVELLGRTLQLAERAAYQSVRGKSAQVDVTAPRPLPADLRPAGAASAPR